MVYCVKFFCVLETVFQGAMYKQAVSRGGFVKLPECTALSINAFCPCSVQVGEELCGVQPLDAFLGKVFVMCELVRGRRKNSGRGRQACTALGYCKHDRQKLRLS